MVPAANGAASAALTSLCCSRSGRSSNRGLVTSTWKWSPPPVRSETRTSVASGNASRRIASNSAAAIVRIVALGPMADLGLFPLELVLLPTEQAPLHIFEPRYKELIGECIEDDREFGLVLVEDERMRSIGTRARVAQV